MNRRTKVGKGVKWENVNDRVPSCRCIVLRQEKVASAPVSSSFPTTFGGRVSSSKHQPCKGVCETGSVPGPGLRVRLQVTLLKN